MAGEGVGRVRLKFLPDGPDVRVPPGVSLFDAASWNGVAIDSTCGGYGTCKKCKVRIVEGDLPISSVDPRAFTTEELGDGWRLACRAQASSDLVIDVPPLQTRPKAATVGVGRQVILRPSVQKRYLELAEPTLQDQVSDLERTRAAGACRAAHDRIHARNELPRVERFGEVVVKSGIEAGHLLHVFGAGGERDHWRVVHPPELREQGETIGVREPEVEDHAGGSALGERDARGRGGGAVLDHKACVLQIQRDQLGH